MAATEANAETVQVDVVEIKAEVETTHAESVPVSSEETQSSTTEPPASTEPPADGKHKPASEKIWDSFLNKSGLGKVMGGKKKKEQHTGSEDTVSEEQDKTLNQNDQGDTTEPEEHASSEPAETAEVAADGQTVEKAPENEDASQEQKAAGAKPKQGEKSSVKDFIRKPVAKMFSHKSTEKKDGTGADTKQSAPVRSRSLDRLQDADASAAAADATEAADEPDKPNAQTTKHMRRWHSFKKLMAQRSHRKSTDDSKDAEGTEGDDDGVTLDSTTKSEQTGKKRLKLKRSWTFQGMRRDPSDVGIHKPADKDTSDLTDENAPEEEQATEDVKVETQTSAEGEEEKGASSQQAKSVDHHANEIWTSFKKRVIPKSKKSADAAGAEEEPAGDREQTDEPQAGKDSKTAKPKRTHFNRAVSLKNFILRKGKSSSVDTGESMAAHREDDDVCESTAEDVDGIDGTAGPSDDVPQTGSEEQTAAQSESNDEGQVADEHRSSDGEESTPSDKPQTVDPASESGCQTEPKVNGCSDETSEDATAHNHESTTQNNVKDKESDQENINASDKTCLKDDKILGQETVTAVAQSE